jgi:hypothetical protein
MTVREQSNPAGPTASAIPLPDRTRGTSKTGQEAASESRAGNEPFPQPKLRLKIQDLNHPGAAKFLGAVNAGNVLSTAVENVLRLLYRSTLDRDTTVPPTRSVTLILRDMGGVAYTTGVGSWRSFIFHITSPLNPLSYQLSP